MENQLTQPTHKHKIRRIIIGLFVFLLIVAIAGVVAYFNMPKILNFIARDIPPVDDSDLSLQVVNIPDSENGYFDMAKIKDVIYVPKIPNNASTSLNNMISGKGWDEQIASDTIAKNAQAYEYFAQAAQKLSYQFPPMADPKNFSPNLILEPLSTWRDMASLSALKAIYLSKHRKTKEAIEESLNSVRVGQRIEDSQHILIEYLVGLAMKNIGLKATQQIIASSTLSATDSKYYALELEQYYKNETGIVTAFKAEYSGQKWSLGHLDLVFVPDETGFSDQEMIGAAMIKERLNNKFYYQFNKTNALNIEHYRTMIKNSLGSCGLEKEEPIINLAPTLDPGATYNNNLTMMFRENIIGEMIHDMMTVSLGTVNTKKCEQQALVGSTQILFAVKAYKDTTKTYPSSLSNLVPNYLTVIPTDPFDKGQLKYSAIDKKIYSSYATSTLLINF